MHSPPSFFSTSHCGWKEEWREEMIVFLNLIGRGSNLVRLIIVLPLNN